MTIKYFKEQITRIDNNRYCSQKEKAENIYHWAKHMKQYCDYLEEILNTFQIVAIKINVFAQDGYSKDYRTLTVNYLKGESSVLLSDWCEAILLPEVEKIVAKHNRRIVFNYITENKAA